MSELPDSQVYKETAATIRASLKELLSNASVSVGTTLNEWLVRPLAILFSKLTASFTETVASYSVSTLASSTATDNPVADLLLGNYFVKRQTGTAQKVLLSVRSSERTTTIQEGVLLVAGSASLSVDATYIAAEDPGTYEGITSVNAYKDTDGTYLFSISATVVQGGENVIPAGTAVTGFEGLTGVTDMSLLIPIEGTADNETDASMVSRIHESITYGIGGDYAIAALLKKSGYPIKGLKAFDWNSVESVRTKCNSMLIGTGGMVDVFVRTATIPYETTVTVLLPKGTTDVVYEQVADTVTDPFPSGFTRVLSYTVLDAETDDPVDSAVATFTYGSKVPAYTTEAARFSIYQTCSIGVSTDTVGVTAYTKDYIKIVVTVQYMPYIENLQAYLGKLSSRIVGSNILVKAAIPAQVTVSSAIADKDTADDMGYAVVTYVNSLGVGDTELRLSSIQEALHKENPAYVLLSPTQMQMVTYPTDTGIIRQYSSDGYIVPESTLLSNRTKNVYFLYTTADSVYLGE